MTAVEVFVDTVRCYDGACGAIAAPEPWFVGLLVLCLLVLWQAARASTAVVSPRTMTAAGTQLLGARYGTALTALLFAGWLAVAFGLSVPALGAVRDPVAWTAMVPLHATLLLLVPVLVVGHAAFVVAALRSPGRFRPASLPVRTALAGGAVALPAAWQLAGRWSPELVADPSSPGAADDALGGGPLGASIGGLWWTVERLSAPEALAVVAAAAACYVLLPRTGTSSTVVAPAPKPVAVVASGSLRRGGTARAATVTEASAGPAPAGAGGTAGATAPPGSLVVGTAHAGTLVVGTVLAAVGGAVAVAAVAALLAWVPGRGPLVVLAVAAGYLVLGRLVRAR